MGKTFDGDKLEIWVIYEEGMKKETIKKENPFSKSHQVLINRNNRFEFIEKRA